MPEMKDSGIEWIGTIPIDWDIVRLKNTSTLKGRIGWQGLRTEEYRDEGPFLITGTDFANGVINWDSCAHISEERFAMDLNIQIKEDDLLVTKDGTIGKVAIAKDCPQKVSLNSGVFIVRNDKDYKYVSKYLYYVIQSNEFLLWYDLNQQGNSTIKHLTQDRFYNFQFAYPRLEKQKIIVNYLDSKCAEIDALVADIQSEIEILEEYKKSVITEAVTKGLNPDVPMKDSSVQWIGMMPEHWSIVPSKYLFRNSEERKREQDTLLTASQAYGIITQTDYMNITGMKIVLANQGVEKWKHVEPNDFIISLRSFQGGLEMSEITGCITWHYVVLKANIEVYHRFYKWLFKSTKYINALQGTCNFIRDGQDLRYSNFSQVPLFVLPFDEQKKIADYLDSKVADIDFIIETKREQLSTLEEYKKSVIYEYVTGKKEVPLS